MGRLKLLGVGWKGHLFSKHYYSPSHDCILPLHMILMSRHLVSFEYRDQDFSRRSPLLTYKLRTKEVKVLPRVKYMVGGGRWPSMRRGIALEGKMQRALDLNFSGI